MHTCSIVIVHACVDRSYSPCIHVHSCSTCTTVYSCSKLVPTMLSILVYRRIHGKLTVRHRFHSTAWSQREETAKFASDADSSDVCETEKAQTIIHKEHKMYTIRTSFTGVVHRWHINIPWLPITNRIWQLIVQQSLEHLHVFQQHDWSTNSICSGLPMYISFYF